MRQEGSSPLQPANGDLLTELWRGALGSLGEQDKVVYITDWHGELCPPLGGAMWSKYYRHYRRTPENVELAEWVAQRYQLGGMRGVIPCWEHADRWGDLAPSSYPRGSYFILGVCPYQRAHTLSHR